MTRIQKIFLSLALVPAALIVSAGVGLKLLTQPLSPSAENIGFEVVPGDSLTKVASRLSRVGVVQNPRLLTIFARLMGQTNIKKGEYVFSGAVSDLLVLEKLLNGSVVTRQITFVEGTRFSDVIQLLSEQKYLKQTLADKSLAEIGEMLEINPANPEGWLFPDTYQYTKDMSDFELLQISVKRMRDVLAEEWQQRAENLPYKSSYEALVMASIVEKETGVAAERDEIAGVFVRRLNKGMRLQTDPTVIYGLGDEYQGNIRRRHLKQATPYNTYVIKGLPPTPIALAGRAAIHAALHPAEGEALFFVAKGDGSHYFSSSLAEHEEAVRKYQLSRVKDYRSSPSLSQ